MIPYNYQQPTVSGQTLADEIAPPRDRTADTAPHEDVEQQKQQQQDGTQNTTRGHENRQYGKNKKKKGGIIAKAVRVYKLLTDKDFRWRSSMRITVLWAITLIIVGIVFVCLSATGVYPESVTIQKELDVYAENIVKYTLYIVAGILTLLGAYLASRKIISEDESSSQTLNLVIPQLLLLVSVLIALATIGMTIQIMVDVNNAYTLAWWSWLIMAIIILQRLFFSCACSAALWTLFDAAHSEECRKVYNNHDTVTL